MPASADGVLRQKSRCTWDVECNTLTRCSKLLLVAAEGPLEAVEGDCAVRLGEREHLVPGRRFLLPPGDPDLVNKGTDRIVLHKCSKVGNIRRGNRPIYI